MQARSPHACARLPDIRWDMIAWFARNRSLTRCGFFSEISNRSVCLSSEEWRGMRVRNHERCDDFRRHPQACADMGRSRGWLVLWHAGAEGAQEAFGAAAGRRRDAGHARCATGRARDADREPAEDLL